MAYRTFEDNGLKAAIPLSYDAIDDDPFYPWIRPTDFVRTLHSYSRLGLLLPAENMEASKPVLREYWRRFRIQFPSHEAFRLLNEQQLEKAIPVRIHGDEGRSFLFASWVLSGRGVAKK